ncbi:hypothetical protein NIES2135_15590 [Leptolyngbya boryana NIES-2135]|jgi:intracellular sulfur oxidation DsrE/DsrF family protein|uniref:Uncharacterized protein n=1 Tax=Leptolyngbya boryana NIES-2135 TaxID=1973484 RepID=A0A1Z4JDC7_LEPBY|nr:hypothetical protein NIES2135_15590 [Leptolyngbya boryana NIES-2135]
MVEHRIPLSKEIYQLNILNLLNDSEHFRIEVVAFLKPLQSFTL